VRVGTYSVRTHPGERTLQPTFAAVESREHAACDGDSRGRRGKGQPVTRAAHMTWQCWIAAGVATAAVLTGCTTADTVMMQHPQTHEIARCAEGYRRFIDGQGYRTQEDCIADYQRKGYERPAGPVIGK